MTIGAERQRQFAAAAERYGGALSRRLLREMGAGRQMVDRQSADDRWRPVGRNTVAMQMSPLGFLGLAWRAYWEVGRPDAALDGVSSLEGAGMTGFESSVIHVSVPWEARVRKIPGVEVHRVCRVEGDVVGSGPPRVRTPLATIRAAHWATSDRQAALLLVLPVQQRLILPRHLSEACSTERVRGRRELVRQLVADIADGAHSLGELDFAAMCRRRGLPNPDRQFVVLTKTGRAYLDVRWSSIGLVVEIDGSGHRVALKVTDDNFRLNSVTLASDTVLRYDLLALRLYPQDVMDQVAEAIAILTRRRAS